MIKQISISKLHPHPNNPRIIQREDVVESIAASIKSSGFHQSHALQIYPNNKDFIILSGHHRIKAARNAGLKEVPCWIRDDLNEDEAYMLLVTDNAQGELSPLEYGIHALRYVPKETGGRGHRGGLSEYARVVGKQKQYLSQITNAAEVFLTVKTNSKVDFTVYQSKAQHLAAVHRLEEELWEEAVELMLKKEWSSKETDTNINYANIGKTTKQKQALLKGNITKSKLEKIWEFYTEQKKRFSGDVRKTWARWYRDTDPLDLKELREKRNELESLQDKKEDERFKIIHADIETYQTDEQFDFIITDPPYPKEYLSLYEVLAKRANEWLKDDGLLIAMCGQSYFTEIVEMMTKHLEYYWLACYQTPGQPTPIRQRQVNACWKPLLIMTKPNSKYTGKTFSDFFTSDANDKSFHEWGQSESGMLRIIEQICKPGQTILDPFCGAGTTGVAALQHGCLFYGIDKDKNYVTDSIRRLSEIKTK